MSLTNLLLLLSVTVTVGLIVQLLKTTQRPFRFLAVALGAILLLQTISLPAWAALGASDEPLSPKQKQLEEQLKLNPDGGQYKGIEFVEPQGPTDGLSDAEIRNKIQSEVRNDIVVNVASGSVILSGTVENVDAAREIVEQVKSIPGVQQITFELGLIEKAG
jgi:hypothetical protein